jgi:hypothetical protein
MLARRVLSSAVAASDFAVVSICVAAAESDWTTRPTCASKVRVRSSSRCARASLAARSAACSRSMRCLAVALSLNVVKASASVPSSSRRPTNGTSVARSPEATWRTAAAIRSIGRATRRHTTKKPAVASAREKTRRPLCSSRFMRASADCAAACWRVASSAALGTATRASSATFERLTSSVSEIGGAAPSFSAVSTAVCCLRYSPK